MNSALTTSEFICTLSCFSASRRFGFVRMVEEDEDGILIERVSFEPFTYDCVYDVLHDGWRSMHIRTPVPLPISASPCRAVRSKESCLCAPTALAYCCVQTAASCNLSCLSTAISPVVLCSRLERVQSDQSGNHHSRPRERDHRSVYEHSSLHCDTWKRPCTLFAG